MSFFISKFGCPLGDPNSKSAISRYLLVGAALGLAGALSRVPFVRATPINWDAVQFALSLSDFDLHLHQPHPPGYILYVLMGRAANVLVGDPSLALSWLSAIFSGVSIATIYWLALELWGEQSIAVGAALLLLASPLAFYYGSVGLTYVPEMAASIGVAGLAWKVRRSPGAWPALLLGVLLGVAGGLRQTSLLVLLPVCAWGLWRAGRRAWLFFAASLVVTCALWLAPLLVLSGGPAAYLRENALLAESVSRRTSLLGAGIEGVAQNLLFEVLALGLGLAFGVLPLGLWAAGVVRFTLARDLRAFLLWWTLPTLALYAVSHVGQYGYLLVVLPPLLMMAALSARVLSVLWVKRSVIASSTASLAACALLASMSASYFLFAEGTVTAASIARNDAHWRAVRGALNNMDPGSTILVMSVDWAGPFRLAGYLLPDFRSYAAGEAKDGTYGWLYSAYGGRSTYALPQPPAQKDIEPPAGTRTVVALDEDTAQRLAVEKGLRRVSLSDGSSLYVLDTKGVGLQRLIVNGEAIEAVYAEGNHR